MPPSLPRRRVPSPMRARFLTCALAAAALLVPVATSPGPSSAETATPSAGAAQVQPDTHEHAEDGMFETTTATADGTRTDAGHAVSVLPDPARFPAAVNADEGKSVAARTAPQRAMNTYPTGITVPLKGSVATKQRNGDRKARPVHLAEKKSGRWKVISKKRSTKAGAVTFKVKTGTKEGVRTFRLQIPKFKTLRGGNSKALKIRVKKVAPTVPPTPEVPEVPPTVPTDGFDAPEMLPSGYLGKGAATDWAYLASGGSRWNPCQVIEWAYGPAWEGYAALADIKRAFAKISGVTGLKFKYVGQSNWRYLGTMTGFPATQADIVVGWANDKEFASLGGYVVGIGGGSMYYTDPGADVSREIVQGFLTLDNGHPGIPGGFGANAWGQIMLHEILHSLGLGHATQDVQVMYGTVGAKNYQFGAGDITGMGKVGAAQTCL